MKGIKLAGNHTTCTQLSEKLVRYLQKIATCNRISPGRIANSRAKSQQIKVRKEGGFSMTIIVVGGGVQDLFIVCNKDDEGSLETTVKLVKSWANINGIAFHYKDNSSAR